LSERIRAKAGESLRQIRQGEPLEEVTTSSLEALEAYTEAIALHNQGREQEGIALLESALELDPEFGMAWRKLAVLLQNSAGDPERARHAVRRAYELRERMSETERWLAEAYYFSYLEDDEQRTIQAYERVLDANPDDPTALNNLALRVARTDVQRARTLLERAVNGPGATFVANSNLLSGYWALGMTEEARAHADRFLARNPHNPLAQGRVTDLVTMEGRFAEAHERRMEIRESAAGISAGRRAFMEMQIASEDVGLGRLAEARSHLDEALRLAESADQPSWAVEARGQWAITNATLGLGAAPVRREVERALELLPITGMSTGGWTEANQISALALTGAVDRAAALLAEYDREWPPSARDWDRRMSHLWMEWALAHARGEWNRALAAIDALQRELSCDAALCWGWWERGRTLEAAGRRDEAREMYARALDGTPMSETRWYPIWAPDALERLGRLADEAGDTAQALEAYRRFADLWADADPELRPRVERVRARIAALGG
ncbi:MAG TPA: tetratricopeptide repeat protein, partial [Longimicrobiales bacterium]|nr:tetratricopeptide repeat protein [Longimicrobiales bacterium]